MRLPISNDTELSVENASYTQTKIIIGLSEHMHTRMDETHYSNSYTPLGIKIDVEAERVQDKLSAELNGAQLVPKHNNSIPIDEDMKRTHSIGMISWLLAQFCSKHALKFDTASASAAQHRPS